MQQVTQCQQTQRPLLPVLLRLQQQTVRLQQASQHYLRRR
jgi:hypothetical protein